MRQQCEDVTPASNATAPHRDPGLASQIVTYWRGQTGQALVEYALILMLIAIVCIVVLGNLGDILINTYYNRIMNALPG